MKKIIFLSLIILSFCGCDKKENININSTDIAPIKAITATTNALQKSNLQIDLPENYALCKIDDASFGVVIDNTCDSDADFAAVLQKIISANKDVELSDIYEQYFSDLYPQSSQYGLETTINNNPAWEVNLQNNDVKIILINDQKAKIIYSWEIYDATNQNNAIKFQEIIKKTSF